MRHREDEREEREKTTKASMHQMLELRVLSVGHPRGNLLVWSPDVCCEGMATCIYSLRGGAEMHEEEAPFSCKERESPHST